MQDIEFTIENNKLYILQTRTAKRTAIAAINIAVQMVEEKLISKEQALMRIDPESLNQLLHTRIDYSKGLTSIAEGLPKLLLGRQRVLQYYRLMMPKIISSS